MRSENVIILAIESSCDDTAASVMKNGKVLANIVANQEIHKQYGGVVPELAGRAHLANIVPVVDAALKKAGVKKEELSAIAFTRGPGLLGSLLVGTSFSKSFSLALHIPLIEIHHMQAHILAHFIDAKPEFPFLCLTVSGGHTQIVLAKDHFDLQVLGETIDDAAGEAFDKAAKILGLPYPGGPLIDNYAQLGNAAKFKFPHPRVDGYDFSFSGLKTSFLYFIKERLGTDEKFVEKNLNDICASLQRTIVEILMNKLTACAEAYKIKEIAIAGGVSANSALRKAMEEQKNKRGWNCYIPAFEYCTDNAAMIAMAAHLKFLKKDFTDQSVNASAKY